MSDRRTFLRGAGATALALATGVPTASSADFDPDIVLDELEAAGLQVWLCKPVGRDSGAPYYSIHPKHGGFTPAQLATMTRWAEALEAEPNRAGRLEAYLAEFEQGMRKWWEIG